MRENVVSARIWEPDKYDCDCKTPEVHTGGLEVPVGSEYCSDFWPVCQNWVKQVRGRS